MAEKNPVQPSIEELVRSSGLIFSGTVVQRGKSTVPALSPREDLVVVRVDHGLRVDSVLGDLSGKMITMEPRVPESLRLEQKAVFFTNSWIHGGGIAVREVDHLDIQKESAVVAAVERLPEMHLRDRLQSAELIVVAQVEQISQVPRTSYERNAAIWAAAHLLVESVLRGESREPTLVYFPTSDHPLWAKAPRFKKRQKGIFLLHAPSSTGTPSEATLEAGSLVALDPADFQPESRLPEVKKLLAAIKREGGIR